ncbi:MAG: molybdopterin oxidoreductase [Ignavibacteriae bacterium HGW-Ignavibacteriae-1]|jgi:molybdopterin-containing oxidoreductase family iron-sulfur binding subunit|nr:MAG: molybdopterin oxidoreductase [Ignavibacteriae bacterium HGW-Ignavibacteriae-1]
MDNNATKPRFWKSLNLLANKPESIESTRHEFQKGVTDDFDLNALPDKSRRKFLAVLGASAAFAATACSDYPDKGEIISYNKKPSGVVYGHANYYASSLNSGLGILIKTREGRPIKVDGNPQHPINAGKVDATAQATMLDLYDPGRVRYPVKKSDSKLILNKDEMPKTDWERIDKDITEKLKAASQSGKEIAIVAHSVKSPSQEKLFNEFVLKYPTTKFYTYEVFGNQNKLGAWEKCYGNKNLPVIAWDKADVIVALECDFLGTEGITVEQIKQYTTRRDVDNAQNFNKLYTVEANYSLTGANSDYRLKLSPEYQYDFIMALINEIAVKKSQSAANLDDSAMSRISQYSISDIASKYGLHADKLASMVDDILHHPTKTLVVCGNSLPEECHIAANLLNEVLGSVSNVYSDKYEVLHRPINTLAEFAQLSAKMKSGNVGVLIHFDSNPAYHLPREIGYTDALKSVETIVSMIHLENESSEGSHYILPVNHEFESWGDFMLRNGVLSTQQPVIAPIFDSRQKEAVLLNWMSEDYTKYNHDIYNQYIKAHWQEKVYPSANTFSSFDEFWYSCLHDGIFTWDEVGIPRAAFNAAALSTTQNSLSKSGFTVILTQPHYLGDGQYANNGWLQEVPHPITKVVWDNCAMMSPATAKKLEVAYGLDKLDKISDMIDLTVNGKTLRLPIMPQPGMVDDVIAVDLGYGRTRGGEVGTGVGFDAYTLMNKSGSKIYTGASVAKAGESYELISSQEHHSLDEDFVKDFHLKRHIIQEFTVPFYVEFEDKLEEAKSRLKSEFGDDREAYEKALKTEKIHLLGHHEYQNHSMYPDKEYPGVKWAMAIDMNKCTACNACVTACNVENNIPIVGKEECGKGREMHWMRIDTYFSGTPDEPITSMQPMLCQHCDNAPCENVCPVVATNHSPEGLNQMTYNRCVGTRYCANNCPYKVRRYNFFDFRNDFKDGYYRKDTLELLNNPEVTVRSRGVMEKCTFCTQRIEEARSAANIKGRKIQGSDVVTACQEACPSDAIIFGDMNDPNSKVSKLRNHSLGYHVLETIMVKPNVTYISRLRNTNMEDTHSGH